MEIGLSLPQLGAAATRANVLTFARTAEQCGYASLWVSDHVVYPRQYRTVYPYSAAYNTGGTLPARFEPEGNLLEPLTLLATVASVTERIRLGTAVMVLPMRQPVLTAKVIATIDHLAGGGRFIVGVGVGWCPEEFEVLGAAFERRGARVEEQLTVMRALWSGDWVDHHGDFYEVDGWISRPAPPSPIPVWLGGAKPAALRRAGRIGDGWIAGAHRLPTFPEDIATIRRAAEASGRDPDRLSFGMVNLTPLARGQEEQTAAHLREAASRGVQHVRLTVTAGADESADLIAGFARRYFDELSGN
jgi:probable F420-dependent oxidoreductase